MYKVEILPVVPRGTFGEPVDITKFVERNGLKKIKQSVDSSDFSIASSFDSIRLKLINFNSMFSLNGTVFNGIRDGAIVKVTYNSSLVFQGVIDDAGTYEDDRDNTIKMVVVSMESLFKRITIDRIPSGLTASSLFEYLFSLPEVKKQFPTIKDISVGIDFEILNRNFFFSQDLSTAVETLLMASRSFIRVDESLSISVLNRINFAPPKRHFYGHHDPLRRFPIVLELKELNTGRQRVFNSVKINDQTVIDRDSIRNFGIRKIEDLEFPFLGGSDQDFVGRKILDEFSREKEELEIKILSQDCQQLFLADIVTIDHQPQVEKPEAHQFFARYGIDTLDQIVPRETGALISPNVRWEIYEKKENAKELNCILKLREAS